MTGNGSGVDEPAPPGYKYIWVGFGGGHKELVPIGSVQAKWYNSPVVTGQPFAPTQKTGFGAGPRPLNAHDIDKIGKSESELQGLPLRSDRLEPLPVGFKYVGFGKHMQLVPLDYIGQPLYFPSLFVEFDADRVLIWREQRPSPSVELATSGIAAPTSLKLWFAKTPSKILAQCIKQIFPNGVSMLLDPKTKKVRALEIPHTLLGSHLLDTAKEIGGKKPLCIDASYSASADALYLRLCPDKIEGSTESLTDDILLDFNKDKLLVGLEFPSVKTVLHID